jgi:putative membrane-bound dehydrogenase-like protein
MNRLPRPLITLLLAAIVLGQWSFAAAADSPLRVYLRSGPKTHGPGAHDHPRFLTEWIPLLNARGAVATGSDQFPSAAQLAQTDVLVLHADNAGDITGNDRANLHDYLARGGGIVAIHAGTVAKKEHAWYKSIIGGSWKQGTTKWLEAPMHLYFADRHHPITTEVSNWAMDDEIYYDMDLADDINVLATAYTPKSVDTGGRGNKEAQARAAEAVATKKGVNIYDHQPQMWTYESTRPGAVQPYRAFVSIPGHHYGNFNRPNYRSILLRGIAWAGHRSNVDELCIPSELGDALIYPADGPIHPSKASAKLEVHPEFNVSLIASEPLIEKVMNITWDEMGRLWVCETPEYPNGRRISESASWQDSGSLDSTDPQRRAEDRISILTDTDGDGVMDTKKVFADDLELITSFVLYRKGAIAATSPDIWFLQDTTGDGVADKRTKLYTGLGIRDTHSVINNLRWGHDGWIYATHGYSTGDVTSPDGSLKFGPDGSGVVRFKPDGSAFEQYSSKNGNTWGLDITWDGQVFWTQPTSGTVFFHTVLPESILAQGNIPGTNSWNGMITNQRSFPAMEWSEQAYVQIDQVGRFTAAAGCAIYEGGAWPAKWNHSYFTTEPTLNIVHHQFVKPDGVTYSVSKEVGREETEFIRSTDLWFRPIENRVGPDGALYIVDFYNQAVIHNDTRGPKHGPANAALRPDRDHFHSRIWRVNHKQAKTLPALNLDRNDLAGLLSAIKTSANAHVKKTALRLARENHGNDPRVAAATPTMGSPALETYHQTANASTANQRAATLAHYASAEEDWTRSAIIAAASTHPIDWIDSALNRRNPQSLDSFVTALAENAPAETAISLTHSASQSLSPLRVELLSGLATQRDKLPTLDSKTADSLKNLIADPETRTAALSLAAVWDKAGLLTAVITPAAKTLLTELGSASWSDNQRAAAVAALLSIPQTRDDALARIGALLNDSTTSNENQKALLNAVGRLTDPLTSKLLVDTFISTKSATVFEEIIRRREFSIALLHALENNRLTPAALGPANIDRLRRHPLRAVNSLAATVLGTTLQTSAEKDALIAQLLPGVSKPGDIANGRKLFAAACAICHKLDDVGQIDVGPPLAGIGSHGAAELLQAIVDPNRSVEPTFWQWNITTKQNQTYSGVIIRETTAGLTIRNQGGDIEIKAADITNRENTRRSLMPEGFGGLGEENLRDLISYLAASAKAPPAADAAPTAEVDATPKSGGPRDAPLPAVEPIVWEAGKIRVLMIGGGSSHKFGQFFGGTDRATLQAAGFSVNYTEDRDQAAEALASAGADVALISVNRKFFDTPAYRAALMTFATAGKGIIMHHPGTWYGYQDWPALNAEIVGGGARGHDKIAEYSVNAVQPNHPVMRGVPASFTVEDELYYITAEPEKIPANTSLITVLAETSPSKKFNAPHPAVWVTAHPTARIVGLTIGHDERVHDLESFKTLLANAVKWTSGQ